MARHGASGGGGWSQADTRRDQRFTDQHGREWYAVVENKTGAPVGPISPQFSAPFYPDQSYLVLDPQRSDKVTVDYARAIRDRVEAEQSYQRKWNEAAMARTWDPQDPAKKPILLQLVGEPPAPWQPYKACLDGNSWALGFSTRVDLRVAKYLPLASTVDAELAELPSFADAEAEDEFPDLDAYGDEEEAADPGATGGKVVPVRKKPGRKPKSLPLAA